jgi:hypothetical protein
MPADYPLLVHSFSPRQDLVDTVIADNVNALQYEVAAVQTVLGSSANSTNPLVSTFSGTWSTATSSWGTVGSRLLNIEAGLVNGVTTAPYVSKNGGSTITTASNKALVLQAGTGSLNLLESYSSGAALGFNLNSSGLPKVGSNNVLYVGSTEYVALTTADTSASNAAATKIPLATVTTAGDLILATGNATVGRLGIGTNGHILTSNGTTASWVAPVVTSAQLATYVSKTGGSIITTASNTALVLQAGTGSLNLLESYSAGAALGFNLDSSGIPKVGTSNVLYVGSTEYNALVNTDSGSVASIAAKIPLSTVTTAGDLILGTGNSTVGRLGRGTSGQALIMSGTSVVWGAPVDATGSSTVSRLGIGNSGHVLTSNGTTASWAAPAVTATQLATTNTNVTTAQTTANAAVPKATVTTAGDLIVGTGNATVGRLGIGTNGQALIMSGTSVAWGAPVDATKIPLSTVTTAGDLIVGTGSSTVGRIGIGGNGTILTSNGTTATWATLSTPYVNQTNGTVTTASTASAVVRNIHTSTTTPVSGNGIDGDVWLVYT